MRVVDLSARKLHILSSDAVVTYLQIKCLHFYLEFPESNELSEMQKKNISKFADNIANILNMLWFMMPDIKKYICFLKIIYK